MKKILLIVVLCTACAGLFSIVGGVIYGITFYNKSISFENQISAIDKDMQNVHASFFQQMKQQGVAVDKYGDMVIEAVEIAMSGRYGKTGSKAAFQWIQEQNPNIDASIMTKLQAVIEAGYNKFEATQRTKIDVVRVYKDSVQHFPNNFMASFLGFPKKSWEELEKIVTSAQTKTDFAKGELSDPDIFKKSE